MDPVGVEITRWAARVAVSGWLVWVILVLLGSRSRQARWAWTLGLVAHLLHVVFAFHAIHHWSHQAAWEHTAQMTERVVGFGWGAGVWVNYVFTLAWLVDVAWSWSGPVDRRRGAVHAWLAYGFSAFMFVNATVVFGVWGGWKLVGVPAAIAVGVACHRGRSVAGEEPVKQAE